MPFKDKEIRIDRTNATQGFMDFVQGLDGQVAGDIRVRISQEDVAIGDIEAGVPASAITSKKILFDALEWSTTAYDTNPSDILGNSILLEGIAFPIPTSNYDPANKKYVDDEITANTLSSGSGITVDGSGNIDLGGTLDANAAVDTADFGVTFGYRTGTVGSNSFVTGGGGYYGGTPPENIASGGNSAVIGGFNNDATYDLSAVMGGNGNTASAVNSVVVGGFTNTASGYESSIIGGSNNTVSGYKSGIFTGQNNNITVERSAILGGYNNSISSGYDAAIVGGNNNTVSAIYSAILGGQNNVADEINSVVLGGNGVNADASNTAFAQKIWSNQYRTNSQSVSANTTLDANDAKVVLVDTVAAAGNITVTLDEATMETGTHFTVIDITGNASTNNIILDPSATGLIDGASTFVISDDRGSVDVYWDGTNFHTTSTAGITTFTLANGSGTTANGSAVDLGGTLSSAVEIVGAANAFTIGQTSDVAGFTVNTSTHDINATGNITLDTSASFSIDATGGASNVSVDSNNLTLETTTSGTLAVDSAGALNLSFASASTITDSGSNGGIQYAADYSANYTDRSLVDKAYVDALSAGLNPKDSARVATTAALPDTPTYNNGTSGVGATLTGTGVTTLSVDGVSLNNGDRVLVKNQASAEHNGIYEVTNNDGVSSWELTRATDFDGSPTQEVDGGEFTFVKEGTTLADTGWVVSSPNTTATIGTTAIAWTQYSAAGVIIAGDGLTKSGNTIDLVALDDSLTVNANDVSVNLDTVGGANIAQSLVTSTTNGIGIRVDDITIDANGSDQLEVVDGGITNAKLANDSVNDLKIDWGTGANQVNAEDLPLTTHTWVAITTPTDTQDALEKLDAEISATTLSIAGVEGDVQLNISSDLGVDPQAIFRVETTDNGLTFGYSRSGAIGKYSVVLGAGDGAYGVGGVASASYSSVIGGYGYSGGPQTASGTGSSVIGGKQNTSSGNLSGVIGGQFNTASEYRSAIIAGLSNNASNQNSVVLGGNYQTTDSDDTAFALNIRSRTYRTQSQTINTTAGAPTPDTATINKDSEKVVFTVTDNDTLTITLDSASLDAGTHMTFIADGNAGTNNVTLSPSTGTIDGAATYVIDEDNVKVEVYFDGTNYFVTSVAGQTSFTLTDGNATTANGTAVDLGGTMTAAVAIDASASNFAMTLGDTNDLGGFTVNTSTHDINASGAVTIDGGAASTINTTSANLSLTTTTSGDIDITSAGGIVQSISANASNFEINDTRTGAANVDKTGIQYTGFGETDIDTVGSADYSTLVFNSLVPKKYVDDEITANALTDGNATTANGTAVDLGGVMSAAVAIDASASNFAMTLGDTNDLGGFTVNTSTYDINATGAVTIDGGAASTINTTSSNLTLSTTTSGVIAINSAGTFDIDGVGNSVMTATDGTLTLETAGTSAGSVEIQTTGNNANINLSPNGTGSVNVNGDFFATGSKAFDIPHPNAMMREDGYWLKHVCLEGDEVGVYYRGEAETGEDGRVEIPLPSYFEDLTHEQGRTVLLTPCFDDEQEIIHNVAAGRVKDGKFVVRTVGVNAKQKFYWEVKARRSDGGSREFEFQAEYVK